MKKNLLLFTALLCFSASKATHFRGIEMYATNISGNTYKLFADIYTKASSPASTLTLYLSWGDGSNDTIVLDTAAGYVDTLFDMRIYHVEGFHTFAGAGSFQVTASIVNWEAGVLNITDAVNQPFTGYIDIIISPFMGVNHFDGYLYHQTDGVQIGNNYYIDLSWSEPDGDSVVVEQQVPMEFTLGIVYYYPSTWGGSEYIWDNVYHFDSIPNQDPYAVSFRTKEYRDGNLIGSQLREFDFVYNDAIAGIKEKDHKTLMEIFPNPCNSQVCVRTMSPENFDVLDVNGKKVLSAISNQSTDLSMLENGIYLIKTKSGSVCKLIKN